jgi:hypothetical protein
MYKHLGSDTVVKTKDIIGIFDIESTTVSKWSRDFLNKAEKKKTVINVSYELPKSFVVCCKKGKKEQKVYISQISSSTLLKRSGVINTL